MKYHISILFVLIVYFTPLKSQLVINELFIDPTPSVDLPNGEFIELYNISDEHINLQNWSIEDASRSAIIDKEFILKPESYVIVCKSTTATLWEQYGDVIDLTDFPSLNNNGDIIRLKNNTGELIDQVIYTEDWYNDAIKQNGGWSLERKNPINSCDEHENWSASNAPSGGTPGQMNSIMDLTFQDRTPLSLFSVYTENAYELTLQFSKPVNETQIQAGSVLSINPTVSIHTFEINGANVLIHFSEHLEENILYNVLINDLQDCLESTTFTGQYLFGLPQIPQNGEILVNEILFNPNTGGVDFIELYNPTERLFSLEGFTILEINPFLPTQVDDFVTIDDHRYFYPKELLVFTTKPLIIEEQYQVAIPQNLIKTALPNYPNEQGIVAILNHRLDTLDMLHYHEDWHFAGLSRLDGVSLERISELQPTQQKSNWYSASFTVGNATPTAKNSHKYTPSQAFGTEIMLSTPVFTPDGDGINDFLLIEFAQPTIGLKATINVFNARGLLVKRLVNNQLIGNANQIRWMGLSDENKKLPIGHYFIVVETVDNDGNVTHIKEKVVLSRKRY